MFNPQNSLNSTCKKYSHIRKRVIRFFHIFTVSTHERANTRRLYKWKGRKVPAIRLPSFFKHIITSVLNFHTISIHYQVFISRSRQFRLDIFYLLHRWMSSRRPFGVKWLHEVTIITKKMLSSNSKHKVDVPLYFIMAVSPLQTFW